MPAALPLIDLISQESSRSTSSRVISTQFGDGYEQSRPDGVNNIIDERMVTYLPLGLADRNTLTAVLRAVGSWDYLTATFANDTAKKWKVTKEGWTEREIAGAKFVISFKLKQYF